jgi:hypothetical protein
MSEKFLIKFFSKLAVTDFKKDKFLQAFYKFYKKEKSQSKDLFQCYTEYITRNSDFKEEDRASSLRTLYDEIKEAILAPDKPETAPTTYDSAYTNEAVKKEAAVPKGAKSPAIKFSKTRALNVLSDFIKQSFIITYEDPEKEYDEKDEAFMDATTTNIIDEIQADGRTLPEPKKDVVFGQRSVMLGIWQDTRKKCQDLFENVQLAKLMSKIFYVDVSVFNLNFLPVPQKKLDTVLLTTDDKKEIILPVENFVPSYTSKTYNTVITLSNNHPVHETTVRVKSKNKSIYICSGSQNICGGNADQGIDVVESMLYMTSSYSLAMEKALHAFPIAKSEVVVCPNVLVFKDSEYKTLPVEDWQKIAVMMAPCKYKPHVKIAKEKPDDPDQDECELDPRLFAPKSELSKQDYDRIKSNLIGSIETALFFGYDTIILDDRGISDNWLPAHPIAKIIKDVTAIFKGRVKEFVVCANKSKSFNVLRLYFS